MLGPWRALKGYTLRIRMNQKLTSLQLLKPSFKTAQPWLENSNLKLLVFPSAQQKQVFCEKQYYPRHRIIIIIITIIFHIQYIALKSNQVYKETEQHTRKPRNVKRIATEPQRIKLMEFSGTDFKKMMFNMFKEMRLIFPTENWTSLKKT